MLVIYCFKVFYLWGREGNIWKYKNQNVVTEWKDDC